MDLTERTLSRKDLYDGLLCRVHVDEVLLPNGHTSQREVVDHVDGVAVLPLDERNNVLTVTQYRYVFGKLLLEIPPASWTREKIPSPAPCGNWKRRPVLCRTACCLWA
jgi:ADP-ribose pyrophosphatase